MFKAQRRKQFIDVSRGKGGRRVSTPITDEVRELLWPIQGHRERYVLTFVCKRTRLPAR
jgi:hypothetical protein